MKILEYRKFVKSTFFNFSGKLKWLYYLSFLLSLVEMALSFVNPIFYGIFVESIIGYSNLSLLSLVIAGYLCVFTLTIVIGYFKIYILNILNSNAIFRAKYRIWQNIFSKPFHTYEKMNGPDVFMRIDSDFTPLTIFITDQMISFPIAAISCVIMAVTLIAIEWKLAIFCIAIIPITIFADRKISEKELYYLTIIRTNEAQYGKWLESTIKSWKEIKGLELSKKSRSKFIRFNQVRAIGSMYWINFWLIRHLIIPKIKDQFIMQFIIYFAGGILIINGNMNIGVLLVFVQYYNIFSESLNKASTYNAELQTQKANIDKVCDIYNKAPRSKGQSLNGDIIKSIEVEGLTFTYEGTNTTVLTDLNFSITAGERIGISGESGSGKTTLLKILSGLVNYKAGQIYINDQEMNQIDIGDIHKHIGYVSQDSMLFNDTIRENLLYSKSDATETDIEEATKKADIYDYIQKLPEKYDTNIGERGVKLSGGQRQRLILARAFLRNMDIYIFDEATSAIDQASESVIYSIMNNIDKDKTLIIVGHRESSLSICDIRYELEGGKLMMIN